MRKISPLVVSVAIAALVMVSPGAAQAASGSGSTYLFTTTGRSWQIWKTWQEVSPGVYNGSWGTHSISGNVAREIKVSGVNGGNPSLTDGWGSWTKKKSVLFRVCNLNPTTGVPDHCSGWW